jgi:hypothetical protein
MKTDAYADYAKQIRKARAQGYGIFQIVEELKAEKTNIIAQRNQKLAELSLNKSPYPARECRRLTDEHLKAIDMLVEELKNQKEIFA